MASADALDDDWWLEKEGEAQNVGAELSRKRAAPMDAATKKKKRRKAKLEDVKGEMVAFLSLCGALVHPKCLCVGRAILSAAQCFTAEEGAVPGAESCSPRQADCGGSGGTKVKK